MVVRARYTEPLAGVTSTAAKVEFPASFSRNMTPVLAQLLVLVWLTTRPMIEPSAVVQMSAPEPLTVNGPLLGE